MTGYVPIEGFNNEYLISKEGRILWKKNGIWVEKKITSREWDNYPRVLLNNKKYTVHRLLAKTFIPNPNGHPMINHKDGNKFNYRLDNLEWCDNEYNMAHAKANGLLSKGTGIHTNKLDELQVRTIFSCADVSVGDLASYFGVHFSLIYRIKKRVIWKHLSL